MLEKIRPYSEVCIFFIIELLAFLSFNFANSFILYAIFGFLLLLVTLLFCFDEIKNNRRKNFQFLLFLIPFILFTIFTVCSRFAFNNIDPLNNTLVFFSLLSFICLGYMSNYLKSFNIKIALYVIYLGLSLLMLICFIYFIVGYFPFYPWLLEGKYFYYNGDRYLISESIKFLMGFSFENVSVQFFQLFGTMLLSSSIGLKFVSFKKDKFLFFSFIGFTLLGLLCVIFTINKVNLITLCLVLASLIFLAFVKKDNKPCKITIYVILGILGFLFILFFLNAQSSWGWLKGYQDAIANNVVLNKLFNSNRLSAVYKEVLDGLFSLDKFFGFNVGLNNLSSSGSWFFDLFITSGGLGFISFIAFLVFSILSIVRYNKLSKDSLLVKNLINSFVMIFFAYSLIGYDMQPYTFYANTMPFTQNPLFLIVLFLIGYTFNVKQKEIAFNKDNLVLDAEVKDIKEIENV